MSNLTKEYAPPWAPSVRGRYEPRTLDPATGQPQEQRWEVECTFDGCGAKHKGTCSSGLVHNHIVNFAKSHIHRDPMTEKPKQ